VDPPEDKICLDVMTPAFPPSFHNSDIVAIDLEGMWAGVKAEDGLDEQLEADCFCPPDITSLRIPTWDEPPGPPSAADDNADAHR